MLRTNSFVVFFVAATLSLPFGTHVLYSRESDADDALLVRDDGPKPWKGTNSEESVFTQFICNHAMPDSTACFSAFHAGPGQQTLGSNFRKKVDVTLSVPWKRDDGALGVRLAHIDFDGRIFHSDSLHLESCPQRAIEEERMSATNSWGLWRNRMAGGGSIRGYREAMWLEIKEREQRERLADALTAAAAQAGLVIRVSYNVIHSCQLFCNNLPTFDASTVLDHPAARPIPLDKNVRRKKQKYRDLRKLLIDLYPDKVVLGNDAKSYTQESLIQTMFDRGLNCQGSRFGGFVLIKGGQQGGSDNIHDTMGYLLQRRRTAQHEVSSFTKMQILKMCNGDKEEAAVRLAKYCANEQTVCRRSFHDQGQLIGLDLLQFRSRKNSSIRCTIQHFVFFTHASFFTDFMKNLLQKRHDIQRGEAEGSELFSTTIKLSMNRLVFVVSRDIVSNLSLSLCSVYGQSSMSPVNFVKSYFTTSTQLARTGVLCKKNNIVQLTLLGAVTPENELPKLWLFCHQEAARCWWPTYFR